MVAKVPREPGLFAQPGGGVDPVGDLVDHRRERATGSERPTHALEYDVVAAGGVDTAEKYGERESASVRGGANQQGASGGVGGSVDGNGRPAAPPPRRAWVPAPPDARRSHRSAEGGEGAAEGVPGQLRESGAHLTNITHAGGLRTCSTEPVRWRAAGWSAGSPDDPVNRSASRTAIAAGRRN